MLDTVTSLEQWRAMIGAKIMLKIRTEHKIVECRLWTVANKSTTLIIGSFKECAYWLNNPKGCFECKKEFNKI